MGRERVRSVVLAVVGILSMPTVAVAAKATRHIPKADLKIVVLQANFGAPAYAVVGTDGVMEAIQVRVGIKNQGDAAARPSTIDLFFQDSARHHFEKRISVPRLGPHTHPHYEVAEITDAKPKLGFAQLGAVADIDNKVKESDEGNNVLKGERFAIVARQWSVPYFETIVTPPGGTTRTTMTDEAFHFEFSHYDHAAEQYVYLPVGPITGRSTYAGVCSGSGSLTTTHNPWAGFLHIAGDFRDYDALVRTVPPTQYPVTISCVGLHITTMAGFDDLDTSIGGVSVTNEQATKVTGDVYNGALHTQFKWQFRAAIS